MRPSGAPQDCKTHYFYYYYFDTETKAGCDWLGIDCGRVPTALHLLAHASSYLCPSCP